ncbi:MAG: hypothetical protein ACK2UM_12455 [Anaerolineales bacterium]
MLSEILKVPIEFNDPWQEIDNGVFAGLNLSEGDEKNHYQDT